MIKKVLLLFCMAVVVACSESDDGSPPDKSPDTVSLAGISAVAYTYGVDSGNRVIEGDIDLADPTIHAVDLNGVPVWLVAAAFNENVFWVVVLADGAVQGFQQNPQGLSELAVTPGKLPQAVPPVLVIDDQGKPTLANIFSDDASYLGSGMVDTTTGARLYISKQGDVVRYKGGVVKDRLSINAMPNSRIVNSGQGVVAVFASIGTDVYAHDVLGDGHSTALTIVIVDTEQTLAVHQTIELAGDEVFEGNNLFWADIDQDGSKEIISTVTRAGNNQYARVVIYKQNGDVMAEGPPIDATVSRWRHLIGAADFNGSGQLEVASTLFPHIGGQTELFFRHNTALLQEEAGLGFSSHRYVGTNIDAAGIVRGESTTVIVIPTQNYGALGAVALDDQNHCCQALQVSEQLQWGGARQETNLAKVTVAGKLRLGLGLNDNTLIIIE